LWEIDQNIKIGPRLIKQADNRIKARRGLFQEFLGPLGNASGLGNEIMVIATEGGWARREQGEDVRLL
jgi:hypothetical protein